ncbi:MAG: sporulation integral membrane protein YlbJ [Defluviitaleaceae bacterium]|nr:sporulation integral membrane protein YlbJ [Defluviitaleaceae bacterium]
MEKKKKTGKAKILIIPALVAALNLMLVMFPREIMIAARDGVALWLNNILPSALPFIIGANLLIALGAVNFIGVILEPVMKRIFNLPGVAGFAVALGLVSGYPIGAKIVCEMRECGDIDQTEGQRLIGFVNNSGPLFILGAVGMGMFGNIAFGRLVLISHYLGAIAVGVLLRFYGGNRGNKSLKKCDSEYSYGSKIKKPALHNRALEAMESSRQSGHFGQILLGCVTNAMETVLMIGGFIILFSVVTCSLEIFGIYNILGSFLRDEPLREISAGFFSGIIEMTNGINALSQYGANRTTAIITAFLVSWGGFSIHFQSISFISKTDIKVFLYIISKIAHGIFAGLFAWVFYPLFSLGISAEIPTESFEHSAENIPAFGGMIRGFFQAWIYLGGTIAVLIALVLGLLIINGIKGKTRF